VAPQVILAAASCLLLGALIVAINVAWTGREPELRKK
jgi:hypothetical protein